MPGLHESRFRNAFRGLAPRVQNTRHRGYCIVYDAGASAISGLGSGFLKRIPMAKQISFRVSPIHREPPGGEPWGVRSWSTESPREPGRQSAMTNSVSTFVDVCGYSHKMRERTDSIGSAVSCRLVDSSTHIFSASETYSWCPRADGNGTRRHATIEENIDRREA